MFNMIRERFEFDCNGSQTFKRVYRLIYELNNKYFMKKHELQKIILGLVFFFKVRLNLRGY